MKKAKWALLICSITLAFMACKKNTSEVNKIETSKNVVKVGEALTVQIKNTSAASVSKWNVQPSTGATIDNMYTTGSNTMRFTQPGTYTINAEMRTVHPDCRPSPSWDTCFSKGTASEKLATTIMVDN